MNTNKTICVGCDHGAYELKDKTVKHLRDLGFTKIISLAPEVL